MTSKQVTLTDYFYTETEVDTLLAGKVSTVSGKGLSTEDYTTAEKTKLSGIETGATKTTIDSSLSSSSTNPVQNKVVNTALENKLNTAQTSYKGKNVVVDGTSGNITFEDKPTISSLGGTVTVEQQASAETGYTATYVVKQNGSQVGTKINIPKDFLVKSASLGTSSANNSPQAGFNKGDKYLDFVINTKDNSGTAEHLYVNVKDLFNEYTADETTLTLSNAGVFSIKSGVIPDVSGKLDIAQTSYKGKNVVVDGTTGNITFENKPTIPTDINDLTDSNGIIPTDVNELNDSSGLLNGIDADGLYDMLGDMIGLEYNDSTGVLSITLTDPNA